MSKVTIYTKEGCPYCAAAKKHYADEGVDIEEIDVKVRPEAQAKVLELTNGQRIVPVIVDGKDVKIGFGGG